MARITLDNIGHSYSASPQPVDDWALKSIDLTWRDGGAYALLGASGCGKSTLLNIISGLLTPSQGNVYFDEQCVTELPTDKRNIAQVFQFPVVYDTMTVHDNLAFPLRNRHMDKSVIENRVSEIAEMLELTQVLDKRASGLTADGKQKISLGRGLVRADVNAIMFDEPLTVIDPHLKWQLRSKLKELHQKVGATMIYVTHDQTEALTFADKVVVMHDGKVVQVGTPVELFEKPTHTFVGHFIGSPGMNLLPVERDGDQLYFAGNPVKTQSGVPTDESKQAEMKIGIRPEFVRFSAEGIPVEVDHLSNLGRIQIASVRHGDHAIKLVLDEGEFVPSENACIEFPVANTHLYLNDWLYDAGGR